MNPTNFQLYTKHSDSSEEQLLKEGHIRYPDYMRAIIPHKWVNKAMNVLSFSYKDNIRPRPEVNHNPHHISLDVDHTSVFWGLCWLIQHNNL